MGLIALRPIITRRRSYAIGDLIDLSTFSQGDLDALMSTGGALPEEVLSGTYAPVAGYGARWVALGDSITLGSDNNTNPTHGASWPTYAMAGSSLRLNLVRNGGVAGNTSAQMLARFDTDVTPYTPTLVSIMAGRNDIGGSVSLATFQANIAALVAKVRAIRATPVICTITPTTSTAGDTTRAWNAWLRSYCAANGIRLSDAYSAVVDPATGSYLAAYNSGDDIHPNEAGYAQIGNLLSSDLLTQSLPLAMPRLFDAADTSNLFKTNLNPLFLTTTLSGTGPSGWNTTDAGAVMTGSFLTGDSTIKGNWFRGSFTASANAVTIQKGSGVQATAGRIYAFTGRVRTALSASGGAGGVQIRINRGDGTSAYGLNVDGRYAIDGRFWVAFTAAGAALTVPQFVIAAGATGTFDIAEVALMDLTALGISSLVA